VLNSRLVRQSLVLSGRRAFPVVQRRLAGQSLSVFSQRSRLRRVRLREHGKLQALTPSALLETRLVRDIPFSDILQATFAESANPRATNPNPRCEGF
jgi:hypothetical protein